MIGCRFFSVENRELASVLRLNSLDGTNRLTRACMLALNDAFDDLARAPRPVIITGNEKFFSAGADLNEIGALSAPEGYEFSRSGQNLMNTIECFPALVCAAISGYCMGGRLDLAVACHRRIASSIRHLRSSWSHLGTDHWMGWDAEASPADWKSTGAGNVCDCEKARRARSAADRAGGCGER